MRRASAPPRVRLPLAALALFHCGSDLLAPARSVPASSQATVEIAPASAPQEASAPMARKTPRQLPRCAAFLPPPPSVPGGRLPRRTLDASGVIVEDPAGATAEYYLADKSSRRLFALRPPRTGVRVAELSLADHVGSCVRIGGVIEAGRDLPTLSIGSMQIRGGAGFDEVVQAIRRHRCGSLFSRRTTFSVELWHHDYFTSSAPFEVRAEDGRRSYVVSMVRGADDSCSYRLLGVRQHAGRRAFLEVCSGSGD